MLEKTPSGESATARSSEQRADEAPKESIWGSVWKGTSRERHPTVLAKLPRIGRRGLVSRSPAAPHRLEYELSLYV
jgi:hypothetical protein